MTLYIATSKELKSLKFEEQFLIAALDRANINAQPVVWNDYSINWSHADAVLIRTIWDYHKHYSEYLNWLKKLDSLNIKIINPVKLLRWNSHKFYLKSIEESGINIPHTVYIEKGQYQSTDNIHNTVVVKPAISATAFETYKVTKEEWVDFQPQMLRLNRDHDILVQDFLPAINYKGEWSLMYFNNAYSHAVLKQAKKSDFRVQAEFGGFVEHKEPSEKLIRFGEEVLKCLKESAVYARVDIIDDDNEPYLMELELIEPELFLYDSQIRQHFVNSIVTKL